MELPLGFLLYDAARLYRRTIDRCARDVGLTRAQWQVLLYLSKREGSSQALLADMLEIEPITLVRLLDRLETAGWVERRPDPEDRRVHRLYLKAGAKPILEKMKRIGEETRAIAVNGLNDKECKQLADLLARIRANLSDRDIAAAGKNAKDRKVRHG